jgi:hypothetical protein
VFVCVFVRVSACVFVCVTTEVGTQTELLERLQENTRVVKEGRGEGGRKNRVYACERGWV